MNDKQTVSKIRAKLTKFIYLAVIIISFSAAAQARDLILNLPSIPGLAEFKDGKAAGILAEIYNEMGNHYKDGKIILDSIYPFQRSVANVISGAVDFQFPMIRSVYLNQAKLPYDYVPEEIGKIAFVLYTDVKTKELNLKNMNQYKIEVLRAHAQYFNFKVSESDSLEQSLRKVLAGRIDGLIHAQEGTDITLKNIKSKDIRRQLFAEFDSCFIVSKNEKGAEAKKILSNILMNMKKDKSLYRYVGKTFLMPYNNWQPSKMGW